MCYIYKKYSLLHCWYDGSYNWRKLWFKAIFYVRYFIGVEANFEQCPTMIIPREKENFPRKAKETKCFKTTFRFIGRMTCKEVGMYSLLIGGMFCIFRACLWAWIPCLRLIQWIGTWFLIWSMLFLEFTEVLDNVNSALTILLLQEKKAEFFMTCQHQVKKQKKYWNSTSNFSKFD